MTRKVTVSKASSEFSCASVSKRVQVRNLSYENDFCMQFHFHANQSHFHKNGFALRLALKQAQENSEMAYSIEFFEVVRVCLAVYRSAL